MYGNKSVKYGLSTGTTKRGQFYFVVGNVRKWRMIFVVGHVRKFTTKMTDKNEWLFTRCR
jgi:hypothetical protein